MRCSEGQTQIVAVCWQGWMRCSGGGVDALQGRSDTGSGSVLQLKNEPVTTPTYDEDDVDDAEPIKARVMPSIRSSSIVDP